MADIIKLYTDVLDSVGVRVTNGICEIDTGDGDYIPLTMKGKYLVLPTKEHLTNPNWDVKQAFHPLCESVIAKDSPVFNRLKDMMVTQVFSKLSLLLFKLSEITANTDGHKKLTIQQSKVLDCAPEADEKFVNVVSKIVLNTNALKGTNRLVSMVVSRNKILGDREYTRVGRAAFMGFKELMKSPQQLFGVKLRVKDRQYLINLLKYLLPDIIDDDGYAMGSSSGIAPNFHALCLVYAKVMKDLNHKLKLFKMETIQLDWVSELDNLIKFKGLVPILPGNKGDDEESLKPQLVRNPIEPVVQNVQPKPIQPAVVEPRVQPVLPVQQPMRTTSTASESSHVSWNDQKNKLNGYQQPQMPQYVQPQTQVQPPQWMVDEGLAGPRPVQQQVFRPGYPQQVNPQYQRQNAAASYNQQFNQPVHYYQQAYPPVGGFIR